jgi:hypothetical protein
LLNESKARSASVAPIGGLAVSDAAPDEAVVGTRSTAESARMA